MATTRRCAPASRPSRPATHRLLGAILVIEEVTMTRFLTVGAAQMGPIQRSHSRRDVVERLIAHLREARRMGCDLVVFPELTLTTFFPRWWMKDQAEIDSFFEQEMPSNETAALFNEAKRLDIGFLSRLRGARQRGGPRPALQHLDPGRARRPHRRQVPQGPSAGPFANMNPSVRSSISRSATSRSAISAFPS